MNGTGVETFEPANIVQIPLVLEDGTLPLATLFTIEIKAIYHLATDTDVAFSARIYFSPLIEDADRRLLPLMIWSFLLSNPDTVLRSMLMSILVTFPQMTEQPIDSDSDWE